MSERQVTADAPNGDGVRVVVEIEQRQIEVEADSAYGRRHVGSMEARIGGNEAIPGCWSEELHGRILTVPLTGVHNGKELIVPAL